MSGFITTRPQRTSDEIAADRKEATTFFARFDRPNTITKRDVARLMSYYAHDWRLLRCDVEAHVWSQRVRPNAAQVRQARSRREATAQAAEEVARIPPRGDAPLRRYAHPVTRRMLPESSLHSVSAGERLEAQGQAARFWRLCASSPSFGRQLLRAQIPFPQWLAAHPDYGPLRDAPEGYTGSSRPATKARYRKGKIRPVGISYDRALQIAMKIIR
ncbi:hypothetical protein QMG83_15380 [Salinibacterium sp. G-O1]|uniref:hypothetical protein n=1 Tax=Salinibacterium sp. G-O1 TaxID=3046208 RepID=UPI0024BBE164|nr:hypothetical protein [Salinibacterium sp. G-O1]MDJ0336610.1 hypothetical protein [Salinibacterium sp. G-O1]